MMTKHAPGIIVALAMLASGCAFWTSLDRDNLAAQAHIDEQQAELIEAYRLRDCLADETEWDCYATR